MKKLLLSLALAVASVFSVSADSFDVSFTDSNAGWPSANSYTTLYTSTDNFGGSKWSYMGMSNNQNGWNYIRVGAKNKKDGGDAYIYSNAPIEYAVENVSVNVTNIIRGSVNKVTLLIADNDQFTDAASVDFTGDFTELGTWSAAIAAPAANKYYKINFNYTNSTSSNGVFEMDAITFSYTAGEAPAVAKPEISGAIDVDKYVVTITGEEGAEIHYTTDDSEPTKESPLYSEPFELWESTTVKAVAFKSDEASNVAVFKAEVPYFLEDFSQLIGIEEDGGFKGAKVVINGKMTVIYQAANDTRYMYVNCGNNNMLFFQPGIVFTPGDTFTHAEATVAFYGKTVQLTNITIGKVTSGTPIEPTEATLEDVKSNALFSYFTISDLTISGVNGSDATATDANGKSVALRNQFKITDGFEDATGCTITGFVGVFNGNVQFQPTVIEVGQEVVEAPVITPADGSEVPNYTHLVITAEEGATIYCKTSLDEDFVEYEQWSVHVQGTIGSTFVVEAYAEKDGIKSETVQVTYTVVKADPDLRWIDGDGNPVTEVIWVMGESDGSILPFADGYMQEGTTFTSSNPEVAEIDFEAEDGSWIKTLSAGTTVITVSSPENEEYAASEASFTLVVEDPNAPKALVETVIFVTKDGVINQSWTGYTKADEYKATWVSETGVEFATICDRNKDATGTSYATINAKDGLRIYGATNMNEITVTAPSKMVFSALEFTVCNGNPVIDETAVTVADGIATYKFNKGNVTSFVLSAGDTYKQFITSQVAITLLPMTDGVSNIEAADDNAPVEYYNLQGIRVMNPENGLYIRRQGSKVSKVIL